ncbi:MAG: hydrogen gas-evolving membrane-bound hydrogenase subunit E, partial [Gammaproteobacteria bacterium]
MRKFSGLVFSLGLAFMLLALFAGMEFGETPMRVGQGILDKAPAETGAANIVTAVVLGYRGIDTLGEIAILFTAATAGGLLISRQRERRPASKDKDGGFVLSTGADLLLPLLLVVGFYIILHGHLTPGGGFQGGVILAAAFFVPILARPGQTMNHAVLGWIEGLAGASFIAIGLLALNDGAAFLTPLFEPGQIGRLISASSLPLLYLALGLKVGS